MMVALENGTIGKLSRDTNVLLKLSDRPPRPEIRGVPLDSSPAASNVSGLKSLHDCPAQRVNKLAWQEG